MKYEIVELKEKTVVGLAARTNNFAPDLGMVIGGLWKSFFEDGVYAAIGSKADGKALGIYTNYAGDEKEDYTVLVACEVTGTDALVPQTVVRTIPAGRYAKFIVIGHQQQAVGEFWAKLWQTELPRSYVCDFEEYQNEDMEHAEVHIYIGLKD